MAVLAGKLLDIDVTGVSRRSVHRDGTLGDIVPMALHAGLPRSGFAVRFGGLPVGGEDELDQQTVLFDDPELMAVLADDMTVPGQFPGGMRLFHQVTAAAELRVLLDIRIITDSKDDAKDADNEQDRDQNGLFAGTEAAVELIEQVFEEFDHPE